MNKIRIGIICPSEIAFRRFMPALSKDKNFEYIGVAYPSNDDWNKASQANIDAEREKAEKFKEKYGGEIFEGYASLVSSDKIDAIYLPLPPALHHKWAKLALENDKHVFLEKPSTTKYKDTLELVKLAKEKKLALHENYMFQYHNQIDVISQLVNDTVIGDIRLIKANFGFPKREANDFRYNKQLGGGALLDCGGYPLRLISKLFNNDVSVDASKLFYNEQGIDLYGSVQLSSKDKVAHVSFGMDNAYKCELEIWGSLGCIYTGRVFTAPDGMEVDIIIKTNDGEKVVHVDSDDSFYKSIQIFENCIKDEVCRFNDYKELLTQMRLVDKVKEGK